jgi:uncharacterized protein (DUF952 family)
VIYHITSQQDWASQAAHQEFVPNGYLLEGFIHCCTAHQLSGVLERYFKGKSDLVLLHIDESLLQSKLIYERSTNDEKFPHVYGGINKEAIVSMVNI